MINDSLDFMRAEAMQDVERVLGPMLHHDPQGAQAIVALWSILASGPDESVDLGIPMKYLPHDMLLGKALRLGNLKMLKALSDGGVDVPMATNGSEPEDQYFKPQREDEPGVLAQMALGKGLVEPLLLSNLARMFPGRVACWSLPKEGNTTSWLALALHSGRWKDAEKLWEDGQPFSLEERAEAAMALITTKHFDSPLFDAKPRLAVSWAERLFTQDVMSHELPVKQGWARYIEPLNQVRFHNLKEHLEGSIKKAARNEPVHMVGVLMRALGIHSGTSQPSMLRPVDFFINAMGRWENPGASDSPFVLGAWIDGLDWRGLGEDGFGRLPAYALADAHLSQTVRGKTSVVFHNSTVVQAVQAMPEHARDLWWSMALTAAATCGDSLLFHETASLFRGKMELSAAEGILSTWADKLKKADEDKRAGSIVSSTSYHARALESLQLFWETVTPTLVLNSNPEAAAYWEAMSKDVLEKCKQWDRKSPTRDAQFKELVLLFSLDQAPVEPRKSGPRL